MIKGGSQGVQAVALLQLPSLAGEAAASRPSRPAMAWLRSLPEELQPVQLMRRHARVANLLCHHWDEPAAALRLIDEVLATPAGSPGLAPAVARELHALAEYVAWRFRQPRTH